ncbi:sentrin-specific protease 6-like [Teleopsis dalmanni]|uniref:sentrin-specific protease 6-like n=1 Tax=Teleopsis dalmanni TaxID=139649 RepID=UPI0018CEF2C0|nr:sentrin-specific protease 6-like [Teleopsis dalmanni]
MMPLVPIARVASQRMSNSSSPSSSKKTSAEEIPRKIIKGFFAICQSCGFSGVDHAKCERCKRVFLEPPTRVPFKSSTISSDSSHIKNPNDITEKKQGSENSSRGRGSRGRGAQRGRSSRTTRKAEPVIINLSSDEESDDELNNSKRPTYSQPLIALKSNEDIKPQLYGNDKRTLLIYPSGKCGISINTEDYKCLGTDQYLNDIIIDFYLKWLHNNIIPKEEREKTYIFSTFFYKRLTTLVRSQQQADKNIKQTAAQKRHAGVQNWTKNVHLFDKDFIIIPCNVQSHWFLAIICFPKLKGPVTYDTNIPVELQQIKKQREKKIGDIGIGNTTITPLSKRDSNRKLLADIVGVSDDHDSVRDEEKQPIKQPLILIFDSLAGAGRSRVVATLRDYLSCEYKLKMANATPHVFNKENMPGHCVKVPQQTNSTDCGLFLLQYVEQFFKDPVTDYRLPIKLCNWFDTLTVTRKREEISNLLQQLLNEKYGVGHQIVLPKISFPTLNGQLVESHDEYNIEFEEDGMDYETAEEEEELTSGVDGDLDVDSDELSQSPVPPKTTAVVPTHSRPLLPRCAIL